MLYRNEEKLQDFRDTNFLPTSVDISFHQVIHIQLFYVLQKTDLSIIEFQVGY